MPSRYSFIFRTIFSECWTFLHCDKLVKFGLSNECECEYDQKRIDIDLCADSTRVPVTPNVFPQISQDNRVELPNSQWTNLEILENVGFWPGSLTDMCLLATILWALPLKTAVLLEAAKRCTRRQHWRGNSYSNHVYFSFLWISCYITPTQTLQPTLRPPIPQKPWTC